MTGPDLQSDCTRCAALCCMTMAFDAGPDFAYDKAAGEGCRHLGVGFGCTIHAARAENGFAGCLRFECLGAGQRLMQEVFPKADWRETPSVIPDLIDGFRALREVHRLYQLVDLAGHLPLTQTQGEARADLLMALHPVQGWQMDGLRRFETGPLPGRVSDFLKGLAVQAGRINP